MTRSAAGMQGSKDLLKANGQRPQKAYGSAQPSPGRATVAWLSTVALGAFLPRDRSSVCLEQGKLLHSCCLLFASEAKVGGSRGRALWQAVDTSSYLLGAEIITIFSFALSPCTVVLLISP